MRPLALFFVFGNSVSIGRYGIGRYYSVIMGSWTLHKKVQTAHIWLITGNKDRGVTLSQMWKFLILLIALSTWIRNAAITCVLTTSSGDIWGAWPRNGGIFNVTPRGSKSSIVKPLSAIISSPSLKGKSRIPLLSTISRSEMLPVYSWLVNVIAPEGAIPISPLSVVWF